MNKTKKKIYLMLFLLWIINLTLCRVNSMLGSTSAFFTIFFVIRIIQKNGFILKNFSKLKIALALFLMVLVPIITSKITTTGLQPSTSVQAYFYNAEQQKESSLTNAQVYDTQFCKQRSREYLYSLLRASSHMIYKDALVDYAAEISGGSVIGTPDTISHPTHYKVFSFGIHLVLERSDPLFAIRFDNSCWKFSGCHGKLMVQLARPINVIAVSMKYLRPAKPSQSVIRHEDNVWAYSWSSANVEASSAPRDFVLLASIDLKIWVNLGSFEYDIQGPSEQKFEVKEDEARHVYKYVQLLVLSNWGYEEMTSINQFGVLGKTPSHQF